MNTNYIITIGRQIGSGGLLIAEKLSKLLGIPFYDKELILLASKESGLEKDCFEQMDEKSNRSTIGGFLGLHSSMVDEIYPGNFLSNESLFTFQSQVIRELAQNQSAIFVGRCADYVLKDHPRCLNLFISANLDDRIQRISEAQQVNEAKALDYIRKMEKKRSGYYNYFGNKTWGIAESYHLCINSSVLGIDETVSFIKLFAEKRFKTDE